MNKTLKKITLEELYAEFEEYQYEQRKRKKDGKPMVDRYGAPIMVQISAPKAIPPETKEAIDRMLAQPGAKGMILYVNMMMDSSQFGRKQAMLFGWGCTFSSIEEAPEYLGGLPSQRQYAEAVYYKE